MGKTRKPKTRIKVNPLGIPSLRDIERNEEYVDDQSSGGPIQAIIDQLQSANTEEKMNGLQSLATLSLNNEKVKLICTSDIVRIVSPLLVHTNYSIRNATAGALRNLSINGIDICEILVEQDILTPLLVLLNEYSNQSDWIPIIDHTMKNQLDEKSDTFLHAINILWNLCESTSIALDNFNQSQILSSFIRCLNYKIFGYDISIAIAQCLLVISEDNPSSWCILSKYVDEIVSLLTIDNDDDDDNAEKSPAILLSTLSAGILSNIPALCAGYSKQILLTISKTLTINHRLQLGQITSKIPLNCNDYDIRNNENDDDNGSVVMEDETEDDAIRRRRKQDLPSDLEIEICNIGYLLQAQRISAETITNICTTDDDNYMDTKSNDSDDDLINDQSDNESVHDYDVNTNSTTNSMINLQISDKLSIELIEIIKSCGLIEKLWLKSQPIAENVYQILKQQNYYDLLKKIKNLRVATLLCLQNLCNIINTEDLGGSDSLYNVWLDLGQQIFQEQQQKDTLIIEASTSLMRSALEHFKLNDNGKKYFKKMTENDLQLMLNGIQTCNISEIRSNWLRMLGILGSLATENLVKIIIEFIIEICLNENDIWTLSESLDALMDIFADNDWENIVYELNIQQKIKKLEKLFKTKIKQQKRELKERYHAVLTVQTNLQRFTKYIEKQMKNYKPQ